MQWRNQVESILRGCVHADQINTTIFGIASIGLLIGEDALKELISDQFSMDGKKHFTDDVRLIVSKQKRHDGSIVQMVLDLIPADLIGRRFGEVARIILEQDLYEIIHNLEIRTVNTSYVKEECVSSVSWINNLVFELLKCHGGSSLLNVDCGTGEFIERCINEQLVKSAIGRSYNNVYYSIAFIKAYFTKSSYTKAYIEKINHSLFTPALNEKVDMIYNSYPLLLKYEMSEIGDMVYSWNIPFKLKKKYSANLLWIINSLQSINENGTVVAFVPNGVLFNSVDIDIRKYLVDYNYIETIISMPHAILPFSGVDASLIILRKNKRNKLIKLIDASEIYCQERRKIFFSSEDIEKIVSIYTSENEDDFKIEVSPEEIIANEYNLGINRYKTDEIITVNPVRLEEVVDDIFRGYQIKATELSEISLNDRDESEYKIIHISDIQAEGFVNDKLESIKVENKKKYNKFLVEDGDIILTAKNSTIKSAIYTGNRKYKAILSGNLIAIRVDQNKISPFYLKAFLDSEQGELALKSIQTGTSIITINASGLKNMVISLLPKEQQKKIANEYMVNLELIQKLYDEYCNAVNNAKKIFKTK